MTTDNRSMPIRRPRVRLAVGFPLEETMVRQHWDALDVIVQTRRTLDPKPLLDLLAEIVVYESQDVLQPLVGRAAVAEYLDKRHQFFRTLPKSRDLGRFLRAVVDLPDGRDHPCLVFEADGHRHAIWALTVTEGGQISRIDILTVAPQPSAARLLQDA